MNKIDVNVKIKMTQRRVDKGDFTFDKAILPQLNKIVYDKTFSDTVQSVSKGVFSYSDVGFSIEYQESEESGLSGCTTKISMSHKNKDRVTVNRRGSMVSSMSFEVGKRLESDYKTPYGPLKLAFLTFNITNNIKNENLGTLEFNYFLETNGRISEHNQFSLVLEPKK